MQFKRDQLTSLKSFKPVQLEQASLQLRLTAGITTIALLGIGGIGTWTTWQMRQMLLVDHKKNVEATAARLQHHLTNPSTSTQQWQSTVEEWAAPDLWIGIQPQAGSLVTRAGDLSKFSDQLAALPWADLPTQPVVQTRYGHQWVLCRRPLQTAQLTAQLYLARDISHDYQVLSTLINTLLFAALLALAITIALIAMYIRRSLRPLRRINQLAVSKPRLLSAQSVPSEMQGLVQAMSSLSRHVSETGERQREFTNSLSHELRTSLCLVQGYLQRILRKGDNLTPTQREALEVAASETQRTTKLLQDLLDLGRMHGGKFELHLTSVYLNDALRSALQVFDPDCQQIVEIKAASSVVARADPVQLNRVLLHLLKNAKQFSQPGQPIQIRLEQQEDAAILQISDQGCGIAEADQRHIFEPFYRVESSRCRNTGGMGLGLAIVKALVENMNGEVSVESQPEIGSTFTVKLPRSAAEQTTD
jgi:signal transduction histidine kinase